MAEINKNFDNIKENLFGKKCCRCKIDRFGGLILGFGQKIEHNNAKLSDSFRGEWEVVIFDPSWELSINGVVYEDDSQIDNVLKNIIGLKILNFDKESWALILENDTKFVIKKDMFDNNDEDSYMHIFYLDENVYSFKCVE